MTIDARQCYLARTVHVVFTKFCSLTRVGGRFPAHRRRAPRRYLGKRGLSLLQNAGRDVHLFYATRDGQSRRIAERIAGRLREHGISVPPQDLAAGLPDPPSLEEAGLIVVVAAVRYGRPLPESEQLLLRYRSLRVMPPLVLLSVNLTARKPGKDTAEGNPYLRKTIARHRLTPALAMAIAGRLDYARYNWRDRQLIRFIMKLTGGPTDPKTSIEYTRWNVVDDVASRIAELYRDSQPLRCERSAIR